VDRERTPAKPTRRRHLNRSSPTLKRSVTILTLIRRLSDPLLKLVPIGTYTCLCSPQTISKEGSRQQSDYLEAGTARLTTRVF